MFDYVLYILYIIRLRSLYDREAGYSCVNSCENRTDADWNSEYLEDYEKIANTNFFSSDEASIDII